MTVTQIEKMIDRQFQIFYYSQRGGDLFKNDVFIECSLIWLYTLHDAFYYRWNSLSCTVKKLELLDGSNLFRLKEISEIRILFPLFNFPSRFEIYGESTLLLEYSVRIINFISFAKYARGKRLLRSIFYIFRFFQWIKLKQKCDKHLFLSF